MMRANQLTIEDFAKLSAALAAPFADREKVLAGAGIDEDAWAETKTAMSQLIAARLRIDDRGPLEVYRAAFQGIDAVAPPPPQVESDEAAVSLPQADPTTAEVPKFTPSYMLGKPLGNRVPPPVAPAPAAPAVVAEPPRVVVRPPMQAASPPTSVARPARPAATRVTTTEELDNRSLQAKKPTPFAPAQDDDAAVLARMKQAFTGSLQSGETKEVGMLSLDSLLPFSGGARESPGAPLGWSLARYASFCIDLLRSGVPEAQALAAAQVTVEQKAQLDTYWRQRLRDEPAVRSEWKLHADRREAELRARRGG